MGEAADSIRATMSALDAKYLALEKQHRDAETKLGNVKIALNEAVQQLREALDRHDAEKIAVLQKAIYAMDAERNDLEAVMSKAEADAQQARAEYGELREALRTPESVPFECPACGSPVVATGSRHLALGRRDATYDCGGCDVIYSVSWGAAGDDVRATAA